MNARRSLDRGRTEAACSQLGDFVEAVDERLGAGLLSEAIADAFRLDADAIGSAIGCEVDEGL